MHICFFLEKTHQNDKLRLFAGGIENQILQLLTSYEKIRGLDLSIITEYSEYKPLTNKVNIYQFNRFNNYILDSFYFYLKSFIKLIKLHKKKRIDIINVHTYSYVILIPLIFRLIFRVPIIMKIPIDFKSHLRQTYLLEQYKSKLINYSWYIFFRKFLIRKIDFIRAINDLIYRDLVDFDFPEERILKITNGIESKEFLNQISKKEHEGTNFAFVGRLTGFKNLRFLLNVFKIYLSKFPEDKLFFYGTGPEEKFIKNFTKVHKLHKNIILCGFINDKTEIYSNLDVIIDPALAQGISNTNLEAMCSKTLLIVSDVPGNKTLIKDQFNGLLFNPHRKTDLLNKLFFFKENKGLVLKMVKNAENEITSIYDVNIITDKIHKLLTSLLES